MKAKIIILMIIIILFTVFVSQNTNIIPLNVLFWKFEMSTIVVISISFLIGLITGFILVSMFSGPKKKEQSNNIILEKENPEENIK
jgi:uncharacterized integral membrane protein